MYVRIEIRFVMGVVRIGQSVLIVGGVRERRGLLGMEIIEDRGMVMRR